MTTAGKDRVFSNGVKSIDPKVLLIDGRTRAELMIDYGLGTTAMAKYLPRYCLTELPDMRS